MTTQSKAAIQVLDTQMITGDNGHDCMAAIIAHPEHGALLLVQGFGGTDTLDGGMVRWRHGRVAGVNPNARIGDLIHTEWTQWVSLYDAILSGQHPLHPLWKLNGAAMEELAKEAGLDND